MKFVSILLVITMMVQTSGACCANGTFETVISAKEDPMHEESGLPCDSDPCSSLFACGACSGYTIMTFELLEKEIHGFHVRMAVTHINGSLQPGYDFRPFRPPIEV